MCRYPTLPLIYICFLLYYHYPITTTATITRSSSSSSSDGGGGGGSNSVVLLQYLCTNIQYCLCLSDIFMFFCNTTTTTTTTTVVIIEVVVVWYSYNTYVLRYNTASDINLCFYIFMFYVSMFLFIL